MMKKLISLTLALLLSFSLVCTVSAGSSALEFIVDELGCLEETEISELNQLAQELYGDTGVGLFFVFTEEPDLDDYDLDSLTGGMEDYFVMIENDEVWTAFKSGAGEDIDAEEEVDLRDIYDATETYYEGLEDYLKAAAEYFPILEKSEEEDKSETKDGYIFDEAELLTESEKATLEKKLWMLSGKYDAHLVVYTMPSLEEDIDSYIEELYDSRDFGCGENRDGVILLVSMNPRDYMIMSNGYAGVAIGPDELNALTGIMDTYLPGEHFSTAFTSFADQCGIYLDGYLNGYPFNVTKNLAISIVIGLVVGVIVALVLKSQLKTVRKKVEANFYLKKDSLQITSGYDIFLYRNVTRTERAKNESSGSSGTARNKAGGSF